MSTITNVNTRRLTVSAIMLAVASVLSLIKLWKMPMGGSVTLLSMLPIILIAIMYGAKWGVFTSFVYGLLQLMLGLGDLNGVSLASFIGSVVFDFIIAFGVLGFIGMFRKKGVIGITIGTALFVAVRFLSHVVSGVLFFSAYSEGFKSPKILSSVLSFIPENLQVPVGYSIMYNGTFMIFEFIGTVIAVAILFSLPQIQKLYK